METFDRQFTISRDAVYAALDSERRYQDSRWNGSTTTSDGKHSLEEWIVYMEDYLAEAKHILSREATQSAYQKTIPIMRKVTAMGVACMEQHGAPGREGFDLAPEGHEIVPARAGHYRKLSLDEQVEYGR